MLGTFKGVIEIRSLKRGADDLTLRRSPGPRQKLPPIGQRVEARPEAVNITAKHSIEQRIDSRILSNSNSDMDEPPRKRRRTSSPAQGSSSPLRKPPLRPSFASPTKASLARDYPNLLPTRTPPRDVNLRRTQARAYGLDKAGTAHKETGNAGEEEMDLQATPSQKGLEEQESPRRGTLLLSPSKRPPRASSVVKRSPLAKARPVHQNQLNPPVEETSNPDGQTDKAKKQPLDPGIEKMKQERARLQREVEELEAQVSRCSYEIVTEQQRRQDVALLPTQRADLMCVLSILFAHLEWSLTM
jgi:hypothetical protein